MAMPSRIARPASDTNFSSGPASGSPTKVQPSSAVEAQGLVPAQTLHAGHVNYYLENHASALLAMALGVFGNGTQGAIVIAAGTTTLTADMHATTLVVQAGGVLQTNGFRVFATESITVDVGGIISCDGNAGGAAAGGGAAGAARAAGTLGAISVGVAGGAGGLDGAPGATLANALGGDGGDGGDATGTETGGAGGSATSPTAANGRYSTASVEGRVGHLLQALQGRALDGTAFVGGAPGGSGASGGGGSGSPGGVMLLASPEIENNGTIRCLGGAGGAGTGAGSGGGGGGGGACLRIHRHGITGSGTWSFAGGAGGAASGGTSQPGIAGTAGAMGTWQV